MSNASEYPARRPSGPGSTRRFVAAAFAAVLMALLPIAVSAEQGAASDWAHTDQTAVRLVSAVAGVGDLDAIPLGLQFTLKPGWKTYWRSPGDAGIPVTVDWTGSENLASADMAWPVPHRFTLFGLDTFGYEREVVFPIAVRPTRAGEPVRLRAAVNYLVCEQICIPHQTVLALDLPAGPASPTGHGQLIDRFADQVPGDGVAHDLRLERIGLTGGPEAPVLEVVAQSRIPFAAPDLIVEGPPGLYFAAPEVTLSDGGTRAVLRAPVTLDEGAPALTDASLTLTLVDGTRGLERDVASLAAGPGHSAPLAASTALLPMLMVALLGGLILNLMPCVLPVLSLKLLGVVGHGGGAARAVRASFLASAAGVLVSFLALAGVLASLKMAGVAVGWGIQFQQPLFLVAMVLMLTLFACNLWGWFEIPLPGWLGGVAGGKPGAPEGHGLGGHFVTGAFATLLATPCSAPFLGTAVGFALAHGGGEIFAIFAALGLGLAAPYLLVAAVPSLATRLPRPGRWMITLRRILAVALAGTALWLLSVLAAQISPTAALLVGGLMLAVAGALWARRRLPDGFRLATPAAVGLLALVAFLLPAEMSERPAAAEVEVGEGLWRPFEAAQIAELVASGKSVFVDVTADWCITCQVNKRMVLGSADVAERLAGEGMVAMRADWTRPDDAIAAYLASFGRYGIPFNVVYGPGAPEGVPLPELLTEGTVLDAIDRADGRAAGRAGG
ncbi:protein-disulfide reductase DsbD family protein [Virgifigura deserti]|uniref:protein-disulfide reductase DsbD family protein n=1 Tax=Virgifigura deserti TaxID=2268457 RepID=UPI003CCBF5F2